MLTKIVRVSGVGLYCDADGGEALPLKPVTLIYGENARGKSTFATILSSASLDDPSLITNRQTIDHENGSAAFVRLATTNGDITFTNGQWSGDASSLRVFDSTFVERNVHSGHEVNSDHRKNLLSFALGEEAVQLKNAEREATELTRQLAAEIASAKKVVEVHAENMPEAEFIALRNFGDVDEKIAAAESAVRAAESISSTLSRPLPVAPAALDFDLESVLARLSHTIESTHTAAESAVLAHLESRAAPGFPSWVSDGQAFVETDDCPFCGQSISHSDLIVSYQRHFDSTYRAHKHQIELDIQTVTAMTAAEKYRAFEAEMSIAAVIVQQWRELGAKVQASRIDVGTALETDLATARDVLLGLLHAKRNRPDESVGGDDELMDARDSWQRCVEAVDRGRSSVAKSIGAIESFRDSLSAADIDGLRRTLRTLTLSRKRHLPEVVTDVEKLQRLRTDYSNAERAKKSARNKLREVMNTTLVSFGQEINRYLAAQFAAFRIDQFSSNFRGGNPRAEYGIRLRERPLPDGGAAQVFRDALSESDKRTLAFAFFLASLFADPDLASKTVVVDDPMSSLDRNRRATTVQELKRLATQCGQLIVLAHDPKFLLDLDNEVRKSSKVRPNGNSDKIQVAKLRLVAKRLDPALDPYTDFASCDLARECESKFASNYRTVAHFVANPETDPTAAATAIRPLLEGYLHRRFPSQLKVNCMFGAAITEVEKATPPSPLVSAQALVPELRRIAYFGGDEHHDTVPNLVASGRTSAEVLGYATAVLAIVHGDSATIESVGATVPN